MERASCITCAAQRHAHTHTVRACAQNDVHSVSQTPRSASGWHRRHRGVRCARLDGCDLTICPSPQVQVFRATEIEVRSCAGNFCTARVDGFAARSIGTSPRPSLSHVGGENHDDRRNDVRARRLWMCGWCRYSLIQCPIGPIRLKFEHSFANRNQKNTKDTHTHSQNLLYCDGVMW